MVQRARFSDLRSLRCLLFKAPVFCPEVADGFWPHRCKGVTKSAAQVEVNRAPGLPLRPTALPFVFIAISFTELVFYLVMRNSGAKRAKKVQKSEIRSPRSEVGGQESERGIPPCSFFCPKIFLPFPCWSPHFDTKERREHKQKFLFCVLCVLLW